jgi:hypothetical protein
MYWYDAQSMPSRLLANVKEVRDDGSIVEIVVWQLDAPVLPCTHRYKYRLYFGAGNVGRVRYDNERGKGDHRHLGEQELPYRFTSLMRLLADFRHDVDHWEG